MHEYLEDFGDDNHYITDKNTGISTRANLGVYPATKRIWGSQFDFTMSNNIWAEDVLKIRSIGGTDPDPSVIPNVPK